MRGWEGADRPVSSTHFTQSCRSLNSSNSFVSRDSAHHHSISLLRSVLFSQQNADTMASAMSFVEN